ncbi:spartin isoform X1 [Phascolarctos cinereus]|uniref:Spartin n=1 Tax=Phascolarctos cinereus TaxID=38626 RepID=A0A6P5JJD4_PHACI|nr:spartin isoform X1 [Phascolarctos cinereus]XP_020834371.1 spartin isoform X1 [Phascolarctos cinereus]XP_020834372.1 spartin isoform X1 [Phascolarctos cinereus]
MAQEQEPHNEEPPNIKIIKEAYKQAFVFVNKGLNADEMGQKEKAKDYYSKGREHLLQGVRISASGPECTGSDWESARQMQQKMQETLKNVNTRLGILEQNPSSFVPSNLHEESQLSAVLPPNGKPEKPCLPPSLISPSVQTEVNGNSPSTSMEQPSVVSPVSLEAPPAYTPCAADGHYTLSYGTESGEFSSVGDDYYAISTRPPPLETLGVDVEELILIPSGVQIFFVTPAGEVSAPSYPGYLRIVKFLDTTSEAARNRPPGFLQVCDWLYPLMPNQSPVLSCSSGVYMFPDATLQMSGSCVGVVLSSELPEEDRELFEDLLKQMSDLRIQASGNRENREEVQIPGGVRIPFVQLKEQPSKNLRKLVPSDQGIKDGDRKEGSGTKAAGTSSEEINLSQVVPFQPIPEENVRVLPEWSEKVSQNILSGASWLSWGLVKGAELTGKVIQKGASKLREHIEPEEKPLEVSPAVSKGLHIAKQATGGAVKVSQFLVEGVCSIANCVGRELAPHVKKHGGKLVPESLKKDKDGKSPLEGAMVVAASSLQGFSTVWQGMECAAKCIVKKVTSETVHTVQHKYGADAGHATDNAMNSAINVGVTAFNIDNIGIKAVVTRTAKQTGKAILEEYKVIDKSEKKDEKETNIKTVKKEDKLGKKGK